MDDIHLVMHGLAVSHDRSPGAVAGLLGIDAGRVDRALRDLVATGRASEVRGEFVLVPAARMALDAEYSRHYGDLRANPDVVLAYEEFEGINLDFKALIGEWQTVRLAGEIVPNDHADVERDDRVLRRLEQLHGRADRVLERLARHLPRLGIYRDRLRRALGRARSYEIEYVSGARIESYHTVWFELHEDMLRLMGRPRAER